MSSGPMQSDQGAKRNGVLALPYCQRVLALWALACQTRLLHRLAQSSGLGCAPGWLVCSNSAYSTVHSHGT